ncbi:hypothetical protein L596_001899 [Steinernema carpocapsae]|uniref:Uncharacterized protein n=1 Tax=Steinernema carpocapsae TaxID=34508 RepID=A0A4U8UMU9_STECR|nr:hypothetical protein L596_001899 [Steinernema carpocapsae]
MPRKEEISKWDSLSKEKIQEILNMHDKYVPLNVYFNRHFEAYKRRLTETKGSKFCRLPMRFHWTSSPPHFRSVLRSPASNPERLFRRQTCRRAPRPLRNFGEVLLWIPLPWGRLRVMWRSRHCPLFPLYAPFMFKALTF